MVMRADRRQLNLRPPVGAADDAGSGSPTEADGSVRRSHQHRFRSRTARVHIGLTVPLAAWATSRRECAMTSTIQLDPSGLRAADDGPMAPIAPNGTGLPVLEVLREVVGALLT